MQSRKATTGPPEWPEDAPWWEVDYVHPRDRQVDVPNPGETFHSSVPSAQRVKIGRDRVDYEGQTYSKQRMTIRRMLS